MFLIQKWCFATSHIAVHEAYFVFVHLSRYVSDSSLYGKCKHMNRIWVKI